MALNGILFRTNFTKVSQLASIILNVHKWIWKCSAWHVHVSKDCYTQMCVNYTTRFNGCLILNSLMPKWGSNVMTHITQYHWSKRHREGVHSPIPALYLCSMKTKAVHVGWSTFPTIQYGHFLTSMVSWKQMLQENTCMNNK